jgi:uncharacterized protein (DUF952 family)
MVTVLHITQRSAWEAAKASGYYVSESMATEGFIHCSLDTQMQRTANKYYHGQTGLLLLVIEPDKLQSELRMEPPASPGKPKLDPATYAGDLFPHIYGPINIEAVTREIPYEPGADGTFGTLPLGTPSL